MNTGRFRGALQHLQALRFVPYRRAFAYYTALAYIQNELGLREESVRSAAEARRIARTEEEADRASQLAWMAESEVVVQMTSEKAGRLQRISTKGTTLEHWNPFIEPGDRVERKVGEIQEVVCSTPDLRLVILSEKRAITVSVTRPERVQVRPATAGTLEFTCGKQNGPHVMVEYAASKDSSSDIAGVLRGIWFLR